VVVCPLPLRVGESGWKAFFGYNQRRRATMLFDRVCTKCEKSFKSNRDDATTCYGCALKDFAGRNAPEEGDFNSAALTSGEMSEKEWQLFQQELESIDHSDAASRYEEQVKDYYYQMGICRTCERPLPRCYCYDEPDDE
jgi:hypothetical protein